MSGEEATEMKPFLLAAALLCGFVSSDEHATPPVAEELMLENHVSGMVPYDIGCGVQVFVYDVNVTRGVTRMAIYDGYNGQFLRGAVAHDYPNALSYDSQAHVIFVSFDHDGPEDFRFEFPMCRSNFVKGMLF